jgi:hypothetical protein
MWTPDDFPGADNVPWQLLIRARFAHEIDAVIASLIVNQVGGKLGTKRAVQLARAGTVQHSKEAATSEQKVAVLGLLADWDGEICPKNWPFRWPPRKRGFEELDDPITVIGLGRGLELASLGSAELKDQLGSVLNEIGRG